MILLFFVEILQWNILTQWDLYKTERKKKGKPIPLTGHGGPWGCEISVSYK
jgi:hypothetical protein